MKLNYLRPSLLFFPSFFGVLNTLITYEDPGNCPGLLHAYLWWWTR